MLDFVELMTKPFVACLVLTAIHVYFGLHVVKRGIIFVDLALAQVSALGATVGFLWGIELHSPPSYVFGLAFTLVGAAVFTVTRSRNPVVPQEALIGIVYVVSAAAVILVLSRAPEGGEELKAILVGHLLFVEWSEIITISILYAVIAGVHWWARGPILAISENPEAAFAQGARVRRWDFLFYATFGLVVTSAVQTAGVLLVFAFLIVPAICGVFLAQSTGFRLLIGWLTGILTSFAGIAASYYLDLPTGATIVCAFGVTLLICAGLRPIIRSR